MHLQITPVELLPLISRLNLKYRKRMGDPEMMNEAKELAHFCRWHDRPTIEQAIDLVIKREPHYPTPQKVMDAIAEVREKELAKQTRVSRDPDVCKLCNTKFQVRTRRRRRDPAKVGEYVSIQRYYCDHGWRRILWYHRDDELAVMLEEDPNDSIVGDSLRARSQLVHPTRPELFDNLVGQVGHSMPAPADRQAVIEEKRQEFKQLALEETAR